ncbi:MAG: hypothetical protein QOI08_1744 [Actinomycetota bacterium]|jgi:hypothetical protein|nr:hypothetical protein [Actinomycetota bacterium]
MAKPMSESRWRQKSTAFLAAVAAAVLVVVLVGGVALGYAIEKNRVKSDKTTSKTAATKKTPAKKVAVPMVLTKGTVDAVNTNTITIAPAKGAKQKVTITKATRVVTVSAGSISDIASKTRVLFVTKGSFTQATAVIVLPTTAKLGDLVAAADANTMSVGSATKSAKITITGAHVEKAKAATRTDVTKGSKVVIGAVRTKAGGLIAAEVLVLPNDSPFA